MASKIEIARYSLSLLGDDFNILDLSDNSKQGKVINMLFPKLTDRLLREFPWSFATKRYSLAKLDEKLAFGEGNVFPYPSDLLRIIEPENKSVTYSVEGKKIISSVDRFNFFGTFRNDNVTEWDSEFTTCFAYLLASELAISLAQDRSLKNQLLETYNTMLEHAKTTSSFENSSFRESYEVHGLLDSRLVGVL